MHCRMKKNYGWLSLTITAIVFTVSSCKKAFEDKPLQLLTIDYIFDENDPTGEQANWWVGNMYGKIPSGYNRMLGGASLGLSGSQTNISLVPLECFSDDAVPSAEGNEGWNIIRGGYSPVSPFDDNWGNCYSAIRAANIFLQNYQKVPWADSSRKVWLPNEARALRAYFYYELIKRYGGVPLVGDKVFDPGDPELLNLKRNSFEECVNYIVSELDI